MPSRDGREGEARAEVIALLKSGDERAWSMVFDELSTPLLGYLRWRGASSPEDTLSEVFLRLARSVRRFAGSLGDLRRYAYVICSNLLRDEARARSRRPASDAADPTGFALDRVHAPSAEQVALADPAYGQVPALLRTLTAEQQHVVFLTVVADLGTDEVARIVERSAGSVKMLKHRAMQTLRSSLEDAPDDR